MSFVSFYCSDDVQIVKVTLMQTDPILNLISGRLSDAAHRNINEKRGLFL